MVFRNDMMVLRYELWETHTVLFWLRQEKGVTLQENILKEVSTLAGEFCVKNGEFSDL